MDIASQGMFYAFKSACKSLMSARSALLPSAVRLVATRISSTSNTLSFCKPSSVSKVNTGTVLRTFSFLSLLGLQKLSVFDVDDMRVATKRTGDGSNAERADISDLQALLNA